MNIKMILISMFCLSFLACISSSDPKEEQLKIAEESIKRHDYETAHSVLLPLAEAGDVRSQFNLGLLYYNGNGKKIPNYTSAREWWEKAAAQNHLRAQKLLGLMYLHGEGVLVDYEQAKAWFEQAAAQGDQEAQEILQQINTEILPAAL